MDLNLLDLALKTSEFSLINSYMPLHIDIDMALK